MNINPLIKIIKNTFLLSAGSIALLASSQAFAETFKATSSKHPVALIELYTSQGCSSCPPAEKWLGQLEHAGVRPDQAIPLALHVDYWDYIGWKDQFAQKYFTTRQYQYRKTKHSDSVYTPQIMFNGEDVRRVKLGNSLVQLKNENAAVEFDLNAETVSDKNLKVEIDFKRIDEIAKTSRVVVVVAENNLIGDIKSGENAGRTLEHNHVVRVWKNVGRIRDNIKLDFAINPKWNKDNLDVVVIVETADMQTQQALKLALN